MKCFLHIVAVLTAVLTLCLTANAQQSDLAPGTIPLAKITPETGKGQIWEMATTGINKDLKRSALGLWCGGRMNSREAYNSLPQLSKRKDRFNETLLYYAATQKNRVAEHVTDVNYEEREQVRLAACGLSLWAQMFYMNAVSDGRRQCTKAPSRMSPPPPSPPPPTRASRTSGTPTSRRPPTTSPACAAPNSCTRR